MTEPLAIQRILFLQKPEVLSEQREWVQERIGAACPDASVFFAGAASDVTAGEAFDCVISPTLAWLPDALARLDSWRWIHFLSAGVEKIWAMDFPKERAVLTKSSGVHGAPMSEYALGAMLYFAKQFDRFSEQARAARWERAWLDELTGRTVMILGMGHVGSMVAQRARAFDMRVIGVQRNPQPVQGVDAVVGMDDIERHLHAVDYLVVCLPLTEATRHMVDGAFLDQLKANAVVIDMSRGGVVAEQGVLDALDRGHLRGAALDVFEEQPLPERSSLWCRPNVLVTPHVSGTSPHYMERALDVFAKNARRLQAGKPPLTPVDLRAGY